MSSPAPDVPPSASAGAASVAEGLQRRSHARVVSTAEATPMVRLRHPMIPDMRLHLAVLDLSLGGCALAMPDDLPLIDPGVLINDVLLQLDLDTTVRVSLRLMHITSIDFESNELRLGCAFMQLQPAGADKLQQHIDQRQRSPRTSLAC